MEQPSIGMKTRRSSAMPINFRPRLFHNFNPNISHKGHAAMFLKVLIPTLVMSFVGYWSLGFFVDKVVDQISPEQEMWLWRQLRSEYFEKDDQNLNRQKTLYVKKVFARIPLKKLRIVQDYHVYVTKDPIPNAYALPGGNIIVTESLLNELKDPDSLLFVLGHELGHFQNRDHLKKLGRDLVMTKLIKWTFGAGVAAVFARFSLIYSRAYSRSEELKADLWGLYLLDQARGHPRGAQKFLEWLQKIESQYNLPFQLQQILSTHPSYADRRKRLDYWIRTGIYKEVSPIFWDRIFIREKVKSLIN